MVEFEVEAKGNTLEERHKNSLIFTKISNAIKSRHFPSGKRSDLLMEQLKLSETYCTYVQCNYNKEYSCKKNKVCLYRKES